MDAMLDFETMGNGPTSAVVQLGAVLFDINTGEVGDELIINVSLRSELDHGFTMTASTIHWWIDQPFHTWKEEPHYESEDAFNALNVFLIRGNRVWSHSTFDAPIFHHHCDVLGIEMMNHYRSFVDLRTLSLLGKGVTVVPKSERPAGAHDALVDAKYQAEWASKAWVALHRRR